MCPGPREEARFGGVGLSQTDAELRAELDALRARMGELETLYREAPVGLCFVDRELRFRRVNSLLAAINGSTVDEHLGARVDEVIPAIAEQVVPVYESILSSGKAVVGLEVEGTLPSDLAGDHTWLMNHHPVKGAAGEVLGIITVVQDISDRKRAEKQLRMLQERLGRAQRVAGVGSWEWNLQEDEIWWSDELCRIFALHPSEAPRTIHDMAELIHIDDRALVREQLETALERGRPYQARFRAVIQGELRHVAASAVVLQDETDGAVRLVGTARRVFVRRRRVKRAG